MKYFLLFLTSLGISFTIFNCAAGNVWLKIEKDHSAKFQMIRKEVNPRRSVSLFFVRNQIAEETELKVVSLDWTSPSIHTLEMKGASFLYYPSLVNGKSGNCLLFTLDTSSTSPWFQYFRISKWSLERMAKEANSRDDLARFNNLMDYVVWEIQLPGKIISVKDYEPLGPEWWISIHDSRKAILKIPAQDILKSRRKFSTYRVCSQEEET